MKYKFALAACARWEAPYIVEWLTYHQLLGFDHVFLYCNDDVPEQLYGLVLPFLLGPRPFVTFRHHPVQGEQYRMYVHFLRHHLHECEWISFLDVDEFIRLPRGQNIGDFVGGFGGRVDCLLFNWLNFGTGGHKTPPPGRVLQNYTKRERGLHPYTKFVARSAIFLRDWMFDAKEHSAFWHIPEGKLAAGAKLLNVLGEDMTDYYAGFPERAKSFINEPARKQRLLATAVVHHYYLRSEQAFHERVARGLGGNFSGQTLWREMAESETFTSYLENINIITDESLAGFWPEVLRQAAEARTQPEPALTPVPADGRAPNLACGKPATQSSISQWSRGRTPAEDAAGAVDGQPTGERKFHTGWEEAPWWQVDLGRPAAIGRIVIYNTKHAVARERFARFSLQIGFDEDSLVEVFRKEDDMPVGGVDGAPLVWRPELSAFARLVRVTARVPGFLHLDQVEVYGPG